MASGVKRATRNWQGLPSGVIIPDGTHFSRTSALSQLFPIVKQMAIDMEKKAIEVGITIPIACDLAKYIQSSKELSDKWLLGQSEKISTRELHESTYFLRIAEAILPLLGTPQFEFYMNKITKGSLGFNSNQQSSAKDYLWEAELFSLFNRASIKTKYEEPDLTIIVEQREIAIACKKIHSEKNVEKVFSKGVSQIEATGLPGIVAFNIDALASENCILRVRNITEAGRHINNLNLKFMHYHERHFSKYMNTGRILFAFVSMSVLVETDGVEFGVNSLRQTTLWAIPNDDSDISHITKVVSSSIAELASTATSLIKYSSA